MNGVNVEGAITSTLSLNPAQYAVSGNTTVQCVINGTIYSNILTFTVKKITIEVTSVFDSENPEIVTTVNDVTYGTRLQLTPTSVDGYPFSYW